MGSQLNRAKEILAYELTSMVHSKEDADKALEAARALFGAGGDSEHMPTTELEAPQDGALSLIELLKQTGLAASNGEAKRLIQQGGIAVDDEKLTDIAASVTTEQLAKGVVIKKGKKVVHKAVLK